mmetsp:Transcript_20226/g.56082  ORF Transcript_20226/g.56082 Transcript_20226/m.56082 type:complete len:104 (+) Transcript_20226:975-1286(+)
MMCGQIHHPERFGSLPSRCKLTRLGEGSRGQHCSEVSESDCQQAGEEERSREQAGARALRHGTSDSGGHPKSLSINVDSRGADKPSATNAILFGELEPCAKMA